MVTLSLPLGLCGYVWVNMLTLSSPREAKKGPNRTAWLELFDTNLLWVRTFGVVMTHQVMPILFSFASRVLPGNPPNKYQVMISKFQGHCIIRSDNLIMTHFRFTICLPTVIQQTSEGHLFLDMNVRNTITKILSQDWAHLTSDWQETVKNVSALYVRTKVSFDKNYSISTPDVFSLHWQYFGNVTITINCWRRHDRF